jgi:2-phosphoglycerate kinase
MFKSGSRPLILAISGTFGVGKTTLADALARELNIKEKAGVGVIVHALKSCPGSDELVRNWDDYRGLDAGGLKRKLLRQSKRISRVVNRIAAGCRANGQDFIVEGVHLMPQDFRQGRIKFVILALTDLDELKRRWEKPSVTRKSHSSKISFNQVRMVQDIILRNAAGLGAPVFDGSLPIGKLKNQVLARLRIKTRKGAGVRSR